MCFMNGVVEEFYEEKEELEELEDQEESKIQDKQKQHEEFTHSKPKASFLLIFEVFVSSHPIKSIR